MKKIRKYLCLGNEEHNPETEREIAIADMNENNLVTLSCMPGENMLPEKEAEKYCQCCPKRTTTECPENRDDETKE